MCVLIGSQFKYVTVMHLEIQPDPVSQRHFQATRSIETLKTSLPRLPRPRVFSDTNTPKGCFSEYNQRTNVPVNAHPTITIGLKHNEQC